MDNILICLCMKIDYNRRVIRNNRLRTNVLLMYEIVQYGYDSEDMAVFLLM